MQGKKVIIVPPAMINYYYAIAAIAAMMLPLYVSSFTPPYRGDCRFFLDTADTSEWDALLPPGVRPT